MKFSNLLLFAGAATAGFYLVKNRQKITSEITETTDLLDRVQNNLNNIQKNMDIIAQQEVNIANISKDLSYKFNLLEKDASIRIQQIQDIWQPYLDEFEKFKEVE